MNAPLFRSVLVARDSAESPNELEIKLRNSAQKLRVVKSLNGGADLLFPLSGTTIAVRYYDEQHITRLENDPQTIQCKKEYKTTLLDLENKEDEMKGCEWDYNFDGVRTFRDSFRHTVVFFVLPPDRLQDQLQEFDSVTKLIQTSLAHFPAIDQSETTGRQKVNGCARTFISPDYTSVVQAIAKIQESITPSKSEMKEKFFQKESERLLQPNANGEISSSAATEHATAAFQSWAESAGISTSDANVVMNVMGSLEKVIASALDGNGLDDIPVEADVRRNILRFFGSLDGDFQGVSDIGSSMKMRTSTMPYGQMQREDSQPFRTNNHANALVSGPGSHDISKSGPFKRMGTSNHGYAQIQRQESQAISNSGSSLRMAEGNEGNNPLQAHSVLVDRVTNHGIVYTPHFERNMEYSSHSQPLEFADHAGGALSQNHFEQQGHVPIFRQRVPIIYNNYPAPVHTSTFRTQSISQPTYANHRYPVQTGNYGPHTRMMRTPQQVHYNQQATRSVRQRTTQEQYYSGNPFQNFYHR